MAPSFCVGSINGTMLCFVFCRRTNCLWTETRWIKEGKRAFHGSAFHLQFNTPSSKMPLSHALNGPFNFVNGNRVSPQSQTPRFLNVTDPSTGEVLCPLPLSSAEDVDQAVAVAREAFTSWNKKSAKERSSILFRAAQLIKDKTEDIALLEVQDSGKPKWEARFDVLACSDAFQYFGGLAQTHCHLGSHIPLSSIAFTYIRREALGVCAGIGAWNFPFLVASWKAAAALACGNTMVFKPSEFTPLTAITLAEVLCEAGLPPGCYNVVQGDGEVGQRLCVHPNVSKISFTGSISTGSKVMASCATGIKKVTLELGGKSPLIIFEDTDLQNAVKGTLMANFLSQGQVCSNGTRVYVQKSIVKQFLETLVAATAKLKIGDPRLDDTHVGATIHKEHAEKILGHIEKAKQEGAVVACGGQRVRLPDPRLRNGYYLSPCILTNLKDTMSVVTDEIFGAVASILEFESEEEVIQRANCSLFGLAGAVFTMDLARAHRVAGALECGTVWINNYNLYPPEIPFGGYKMSGIGRENGLAVIEHYTQLKSVYVELGDVDCPFIE